MELKKQSHKSNNFDEKNIVSVEQQEEGPSEEEVAQFTELLDSPSEDDVEMGISFFSSNQNCITDPIFQKIASIFTGTDNLTIAEYAIDFFTTLCQSGFMTDELLESTLSAFSSFIDSDLRGPVLKCLYEYVQNSSYIRELCISQGITAHIFEIIFELLPSMLNFSTTLVHAISIVSISSSIPALGEDASFWENLGNMIQQVVALYLQNRESVGLARKKWNSFIKACLADFTTIIENASDEFIASVLTPDFVTVLNLLYSIGGETSKTMLKFVATASGCEADEISAVFVEIFLNIIKTTDFSTFGQSELTYTGRILYNLASCDTPEIIGSLLDESVDEFINYTVSNGSFSSNVEIISALCSLISTGNDEVIESILEKHLNLVNSILSLFNSKNNSVLLSCLGCTYALLSHLSVKNPEMFEQILDMMTDSGAIDALDSVEEINDEDIADMVEKIRSIIDFEE